MEYKPRKRSQSINRRLAKLEAVLGAGTAVGGAILGAGIALEKSTLMQHSHGAAHLAFTIASGVLQVGGGSVADLMLVLVVGSALIAKTNPKEFASSIPRNFIQEYKEVIFDPKTYRLPAAPNPKQRQQAPAARP